MQVAGTAYTFTCPTRYAVQGLVARGGSSLDNPIWLYVFNHSFSFDGWGEKFSFCNGHSCKVLPLPQHTLNQNFNWYHIKLF